MAPSVVAIWLLIVKWVHAAPSLAEQYLRQPRQDEPDVFWGSIGHRWERYQALGLQSQTDSYPDQSPLIWGGIQLQLDTEDSSGAGLSALVRNATPHFWYGMSATVVTNDRTIQTDLPELVVGTRYGSWSLWAGMRARWIGNGRFGNLLYGDSTKPIPSVVLDWTQPKRGPWGQFYVEMGLGQLVYVRSDVQRPLMLHMDFRYQPVEWLELSATRLSLMGGQGRPMPSMGQVILPTDPHIENDPNQRLPDQDELACLEAYGRLPLEDFGILTGVELWFQYGAEDAIQKRMGVLPYVSLAGVARLGGVSVHASHWRLSFEAADIIDDRFRWYQGHRIYHDGFSVEDQWLGYPSGGDSYSLASGLAWLHADTGAALRYHHVLRVGAIQSVNGQNYALIDNEVQQRLGGEYWRSIGQNRLSVEINVAQINNADFIPQHQRQEGSMMIHFARAWELH